MSEIKTWQERIEEFAEIYPAIPANEGKAKQAEINDLRVALAERDAKLAAMETQASIGTVYTGSATRDGFRIVWEDGHTFPDGITKLYAAAGAAPDDRKDRLDKALAGVFGWGKEAGAAPMPDMSAGWIRACEDEMISAHLGVANLSDSYESAKAKLKSLIDWHVAVATDPAVNGGYQLVPTARKITTTRIANHLKKSPLGDISMYRDGFFDGAKWAAKEPNHEN